MLMGITGLARVFLVLGAVLIEAVGVGRRIVGGKPTKKFSGKVFAVAYKK